MSVVINTPSPLQQRYPIGTRQASGRPTGVSPTPSGGAGTFSLSAGGRVAGSTLSGTLAPLNIGSGAQGAQIQFGGNGADNATANARIWLVESGINMGAAPVLADATDKQIHYFGTVAITLSTSVGVGSDVTNLVLDSERMADTLVWTGGTAATTPKGISDVVITAYSSPAIQTYSPADNSPALLLIPRFGWPGGLVIEFDQAGFFALVALK